MGKTLQEVLSDATANHWASGHFNISNVEQLRAITNAAKEMKTPVLIGVSEGEREFISLPVCVAIVEIYRKITGLPLFLNADHTKTFEGCKEAIDAGFDSIHIDASVLPFQENLEITKKVVEYARSKNPQISIEGELGYLRGSSAIQQVKIEVKPEDYTDPAQAREFVQQTAVNRLAIAVGNIHGISLEEPKLDIPRIQAIRQQVPSEVALTLHAASGIPDQDIQTSIDAGIANIHINTEIRVVFSEKLREFLAAHPEETTPYKFYPEAIEAVAKRVKEKLQIFRSCDRI